VAPLRWVAEAWVLQIGALVSRSEAWHLTIRALIDLR
jgi:hypothetical protein